MLDRGGLCVQVAARQLQLLSAMPGHDDSGLEIWKGRFSVTPVDVPLLNDVGADGDGIMIHLLRSYIAQPGMTF